MNSQIKIKQEKFSDSDEEAAFKNLSAVKKREDDSSSDSESSDDDPDDQLRNVKKEKITSGSSSSSSASSSVSSSASSGASSSDSDSSSSDDSNSRNGDILAKRIKKEKDEDGTFAMPSHPTISRPIKSEPMTDVEEGTGHNKAPADASKKKVSDKRTLSISEHMDSFLADAINKTSQRNIENGSAKKKRKTTTLDETDLADLTAKFKSPAMSSTLLSNAKVPKASPTKVKKEVQSEDERPKTKKNKNSSQQSLESIESELFKSYAG